MALAGDKAEVGTAELHRHSECLTIAAGYICTPLGRCPENRQRRRIGIDCHHALDIMHGIGKTGEVFYYPVTVGTWKKHSGNVSGTQFDFHCLEIGNTLLLGNKREIHAMEAGICTYHFKNILRKRG